MAAVNASSFDAPNEVWTLVLAGLKDMRDFSRAQAVSHTFQAIVQEKFWQNINQLTINMWSDRTFVSVNGLSGRFSPENCLGLVKELARKAPEIVYLRLRFMGWNESSRQILKHLAVHNFRRLAVVAQSRWCNPFMHASMAGLFRSVAPTLTVLHVNMTEITTDELAIIPARLQQAFRSCSNLEALCLVFYGVDSLDGLVEPLLSGKTQMKKLSILCASSQDLLPERLAETIISSGASLRDFEYNVQGPNLLDAYKAEVERRQLANHPLQSIQKLVLSELGAMVSVIEHLDLFPQLKTLTFNDPCCEETMTGLSRLVRVFLSRNKYAQGDPKQLQCNMECLPIASVPDLLGLVGAGFPCCIGVEDGAHGGKVANFSKGNAHVKVLSGLWLT